MALTLTLPRLAAPAGLQLAGRPGGTRQDRAPTRAVRCRPGAALPALPGAFDMTFLPFHGEQVHAAGSRERRPTGFKWILSPTAAKVAAGPARTP